MSTRETIDHPERAARMWNARSARLAFGTLSRSGRIQIHRAAPHADFNPQSAIRNSHLHQRRHHGDEPAGPLVALQLIQENRWPENAEIFLLPCLNPLASH